MNNEIEKIIEWGNREKSIRAIILEGSRGTGRVMNEDSDFDVNIFTEDSGKFITNDTWMAGFGEVLVYQKERIFHKNMDIPTRLVIFNDLVRIDFSFWPPELLEKENADLPESYRNGYRILLDKDGTAGNIPVPDGKGFSIDQPLEKEFLETVYNFWFEMLALKKYIRRNNLWFAKTIIDGPVRKFLFRMLLWYESRGPGWGKNEYHLLGKNLEDKISPELLERIPAIFSVYDQDLTVKSCLAIMDLFREMAERVGVEIGFRYPSDKIRLIENSAYRLADP